MTRNRRSKHAIRSHMAQTGEKYTQARRKLAAAGGTSGGDPGPTISWPQDSLGWFTDQAHNAILLADDEARMLSHRKVEPEHLLLAATRYGNVERLLAGKGIGARAIHDAIAAIRGFGGKQSPYAPATGIFTPEARRVAEDVLIIAERLDHKALTTGHLLLAILERYAYLTIDFIDVLPPGREITAAVTGALPGEEDT